MNRIRYQNRQAPFLPSFNLASGRSPWSGLEQHIDRLFETAFTGLTPAAAGYSPPVDIYEDKDNTYVRADLPGFERDDISVEMVDAYLTLSANRKGQGSDGEEYQVQRSISIPESVQVDKVSATYEDGVLLVTLPKQESMKPRKIAVNVN